MITKLKNTLLSIAFIPLFAIQTIGLNNDSTGSIAFNTSNISQEESQITDENVKIERLEKAKKIDTYFKERSMPLAGYGLHFVTVAEKYGLPYNLLPAISIRESSGGKNLHLCGYNPFGWGSCRNHNFVSFYEAIETVGRNLGGANKNTAAYYAGNDVENKLYYYNGTVVHTYEEEVIDIMEKIDKQIVNKIDAKLTTKSIKK